MYSGYSTLLLFPFCAIFKNNKDTNESSIAWQLQGTLPRSSLVQRPPLGSLHNKRSHRRFVLFTELMLLRAVQRSGKPHRLLKPLFIMLHVFMFISRTFKDKQTTPKRKKIPYLYFLVTKNHGPRVSISCCLPFWQSLPWGYKRIFAPHLLWVVHFSINSANTKGCWRWDSLPPLCTSPSEVVLSVLVPFYGGENVIDHSV